MLGQHIKASRADQQHVLPAEEHFELPFIAGRLQVSARKLHNIRLASEKLVCRLSMQPLSSVFYVSMTSTREVAMDLGVVLMEVHRDLVRTQYIGGAWAVVCSDMRDMAIMEQKGQEARVRSNLPHLTFARYKTLVSSKSD
jgi:hypothetical protein